VLKNKEEFLKLSREQQIGELLLACPLRDRCHEKNCQWKQVQALKLCNRITWLENQDRRDLDSMLKTCLNLVKKDQSN
jgi:hypothetical protein